jgi:hypothetical protein
MAEPEAIRPNDKIELLRKAILDLHGCASSWLGSISVHETDGGNALWHGVVSVFALVNHAKAERCFAWASSDATPRIYAVLAIPPINSAADAVRAALVSDLKRGRPS